MKPKPFYMYKSAKCEIKECCDKQRNKQKVGRPPTYIRVETRSSYNKIPYCLQERMKPWPSSGPIQPLIFLSVIYQNSPSETNGIKLVEFDLDNKPALKSVYYTSISSGSLSSCSSSRLIAMVTKSLSVMMPTNSPCSKTGKQPTLCFCI